MENTKPGEGGDGEDLGILACRPPSRQGSVRRKGHWGTPDVFRVGVLSPDGVLDEDHMFSGSLTVVLACSDASYLPPLCSQASAAFLGHIEPLGEGRWGWAPQIGAE